MAKVLPDDLVVMQSWQVWVRTVAIGAVVGIAIWAITILLTRYVIEPLNCRDIADAANCINATSIAGNIAAILTALLAIVVLVRLRVAQPIILAVGSAALLWNLSEWTSGLFWLETLSWSILLYALSYGLFAWLVRYTRLVTAIIIAIVIVLIIRIALIL